MVAAGARITLGPLAPSSALAELGTLQPGALVFLQAVNP